MSAFFCFRFRFCFSYGRTCLTFLRRSQLKLIRFDFSLSELKQGLMTIIAQEFLLRSRQAITCAYPFQDPTRAALRNSHTFHIIKKKFHGHISVVGIQYYTHR